MDAFLISLGAIFVAEFGDKSQLLVLAFATRHAALPVIAGIVAGAAVIQGVSVAIGAGLGTVLPETAVSIVAGVAFLAVAAWTLLGADDDGATTEEAHRDMGRRRGWIGVAVLVAGTFIVGGLGDKTMLVTFALAARLDPILTWLGATAGMVAANLVAVVVGRGIGARLDPRTIRIGSAVLFAAAGLLVIVSALAAG